MTPPSLTDSDRMIRGAAAQLLLDSGDPEQNRATLEAYILIAQNPPDWARVAELGSSARPATEQAARDEDDRIRSEANRLLGLINRTEIAASRSIPRERAGWRQIFRTGALPHERAGRDPVSAHPKILILTPMKDAADCIASYFEGLRNLSYPRHLISIGVLESDSSDDTYPMLKRLEGILNREFRRFGLWKNDFGFQIPRGRPRWAPELQQGRRTVLARSRNHLLFHALDDEDWVLWLDADVMEYPSDILQKLLETGKDIVHPNCVIEFGGRSFDTNAWRDQGRLHLDDLRREGPLVKLDAVGGTMLFVRADAHRDGLVFPAYPYGRGNPRIRPDVPELETEGLGLMAQDMGYQCWGMPYVEIRHRNK